MPSRARLLSSRVRLVYAYSCALQIRFQDLISTYLADEVPPANSAVEKEKDYKCAQMPLAGHSVRAFTLTSIAPEIPDAMDWDSDEGRSASMDAKIAMMELAGGSPWLYALLSNDRNCRAGRWSIFKPNGSTGRVSLHLKSCSDDYPLSDPAALSAALSWLMIIRETMFDIVADDGVVLNTDQTSPTQLIYIHEALLRLGKQDGLIISVDTHWGFPGIVGGIADGLAIYLQPPSCSRPNME